jgi:hypothetical protein
MVRACLCGGVPYMGPLCWRCAMREPFLGVVRLAACPDTPARLATRARHVAVAQARLAARQAVAAQWREDLRQSAALARPAMRPAGTTEYGSTVRQVPMGGHWTGD